MKTKEQIARWLGKQPWFSTFSRRAFEGDCPMGVNAVLCLHGHYLERTITDAFFWWQTPEGYIYWEHINNEFIRWFDNDGE